MERRKLIYLFSIFFFPYHFPLSDYHFPNMKLFTSFLIIFLLFFIIASDVQAQSWVRSVLGTELIPEGCRKGRQPDPRKVVPADSDVQGPLEPGQERAAPQDFIGALPQGVERDNKPCGVEEIIQTMINVTRLILGVMGSVALLMFTYGGLKFILSAGNSDRVSQAKTILTNAVIGLILILGAWSIVNLIVITASLGRGGLGKTGQIFEGKEITSPPVDK